MYSIFLIWFLFIPCGCGTTSSSRQRQSILQISHAAWMDGPREPQHMHSGPHLPLCCDCSTGPPSSQYLFCGSSSLAVHPMPFRPIHCCSIHCCSPLMCQQSNFNYTPKLNKLTTTFGMTNKSLNTFILYMKTILKI